MTVENKQAFSDDEIRMLAECERMMDTGVIPFVVLGDQRVAVSKVVMDELDLKQGQTINSAIFGAILRHNIAWIKTEIALKKAGKREADG